MAFYDKFIIKPGTEVDLDKFDPDDTAGWKKEDAKARTAKNHARMKELQEVLYAEHKRSLCAVFQAMDAGGKDGAINNNGSVMNIEGVRAPSFKAPNTKERDQDFITRVEIEIPTRGMIGMLNRSHYEDVLVARVKNFAPKETIKKRYGHINNFEERHEDNGTEWTKFYLLISQEEQWKRFGARAGDPDKLWKLADGTLKDNNVDLAEIARKLEGLDEKDLVKAVRELIKDAKKNAGEYEGGDLMESTLWEEHRKAANIALTKTSKKGREWIIVPSNHKWFRDLVVSQVMVDRLESMKLKFPEPAVNTDKILERHFSGKKWKNLREVFNQARLEAANDSDHEKKRDKPEHKRGHSKKDAPKQKHG
ncbi:MAG: polyphosphate kinase 2 family protein [Alphaproteobacteria bacterium]